MKYFYLLSFLFFLSDVATAQNEIYLKNNKKIAGQLTDIAGDKVKYAVSDKLGSPKTRLKADQLVLVFNSYGDYLVFGNGAMFSRNEGDDFIHETGIPRNNDLVFDNKGGIFTAKVLTPADKGDTISMIRNGIEVHVAANTLIAIIHKNGMHTLFVSADKAIQYLTENVKVQINQLLKKPEEMAIVKAAPVIKPADVPLASVSAPVAPHMDTASFRRKSVQKIRDFEGYIKNIIDPNTPSAQSDKSIDLASALFVPNAHIETSSLNTPLKKKSTIHQYLVSLQQNSTHYSAVNVSFASIYYATNFSPNPDGTWSAVVTVVQKYEALADGKVVYSDVTTKNISVTIKRYQKTEANGYTEGWDVFLGDISVLQTEKS